MSLWEKMLCILMGALLILPLKEGGESFLSSALEARVLLWGMKPKILMGIIG